MSPVSKDVWYLGEEQVYQHYHTGVICLKGCMVSRGRSRETAEMSKAMKTKKRRSKLPSLMEVTTPPTRKEAREVCLTTMSTSVMTSIDVGATAGTDKVKTESLRMVNLMLGMCQSAEDFVKQSSQPNQDVNTTQLDLEGFNNMAITYDEENRAERLRARLTLKMKGQAVSP